MFSKRNFLILNSCFVMLIALAYGVSPNWFASHFLNLSEISIDISHILRAIMGLYIGLAFFWLYAAFHRAYHDVGIVVFLIFAGGLVVGRIISLLLDGMPSPILMLYVVIELGALPLGLWFLKRPPLKNTPFQTPLS